MLFPPDGDAPERTNRGLNPLRAPRESLNKGDAGRICRGQGSCQPSYFGTTACEKAR